MGRAHCIALASEGLRVAVNDVDEQAARATEAAVLDAGGQALAVPGDVSKRSDVENAVESVVASWQRIDVVVSNAGVVHSGTGLLETDDDDWRRTLDVHLGGCLNVTRACMPWLLRSPAGRIVIVGSMWGQCGEGHSYAYVAAKGGLAAFGRNLAQEFGHAGICVNTITPGSVPTRMAADFSPADIAKDCESIPLGRWADAEEISALVVFLSSEGSSYLTGQTIAINGGQVMCGY
jgi:NAD(P)-dependent dehydrogenase (short-subunit alcohol dehydrogenase family)